MCLQMLCFFGATILQAFLGGVLAGFCRGGTPANPSREMIVEILPPPVKKLSQEEKPHFTDTSPLPISEPVKKAEVPPITLPPPFLKPAEKRKRPLNKAPTEKAPPTRRITALAPNPPYPTPAFHSAIINKTTPSPLPICQKPFLMPTQPLPIANHVDNIPIRFTSLEEKLKTLRELPHQRAPLSGKSAKECFPVEKNENNSDVFESNRGQSGQPIDRITRFLRQIRKQLEKAKEYPEEARRQKIIGTVNISFRINAQGLPLDIQAREDSPALLRNCSIQLLSRQKFTLPPPEWDVDKRIEIPFHFNLY